MWYVNKWFIINENIIQYSKIISKKAFNLKHGYKVLL